MSDVLLPPLPNFREWPYTHEELRARDLEVARVVLEAAANAAEDQTQEYEAYTGQPLNLAYRCAEAIRALEFKHAE